jgi:hypothetical protein
MLQSVAYAARIRNGYSGWNGHASIGLEPWPTAGAVPSFAVSAP